MDIEAWWATVHRVAKSQTQLKQLSTAHIYGLLANDIPVVSAIFTAFPLMSKK